MLLPTVSRRSHDHLQNRTVSRRDFVRVCTLAALTVGLPASAGAEIASAIAAGKKPSVIWLSFMECTGCTETLLRTTTPALDELILDLISLDYHEALMVPAGHQAEAARHEAMEAHRGEFILVTEGAIPTADGGIHCKIGGRTALEILHEAADMAGAIVAVGSCASWGGLPSGEPNPTDARGVPDIITDRAVVTIPGCPPNPYNFLGTALQYATFGTLPALDNLGRPLFAYGRTVHDHCPRRSHFDAGRFAKQFGDEGHRQGWCLYELGCKGPQTYANCPTQHFNEVVGAWPVGIGHPCFGCTEKGVAFNLALHETVALDRAEPPTGYPSVTTERPGVSPMATGLGGLVVGGLAGGAWVTSRKLTGIDRDLADTTESSDREG